MYDLMQDREIYMQEHTDMKRRFAFISKKLPWKKDEMLQFTISHYYPEERKTLPKKAITPAS